MARPFFVLLTLSLLLSACTQRMICPAYQSAFVYDKNELRKRFSYFQEDSTPKMLMASKTKYLIAEPVSYRRKVRSMQTIPMRDVNPVLPDSMTMTEEELIAGMDGEDGVVPGAELDLAARSVIDSTYIVDVPQDTSQTYADSIYVISKDKELRFLKFNNPDSVKFDEATGKYVAQTPEYVVTDIRFNVEQDNYMWYLRDNLVLPDVRLSQIQQKAQKEAESKSAKKAKEKKGFLGFFKNLFKKKEKAPIDSTEQEVQPKPIDEFDFIENDSIRQHQQDSIRAAQPAEKKGALSFLKKKDKKKEKSSEEEIVPPEEKPKKKRREKNAQDEATTEQKEEEPLEEEKEDEEVDSF
jgi:hypothetical protein